MLQTLTFLIVVGHLVYSPFCNQVYGHIYLYLRVNVLRLGDLAFISAKAGLRVTPTTTIPEHKPRDVVLISSRDCNVKVRVYKVE